jgi:SAM-dependent methyltransferase
MAEGAETDDATTATDDADYLAQVMAEIDEEVRRQRASGDLPARVERELDELFLQHSPVAGHGGGLDDALRMVDAAAFIDPVVPVASNRSGGAVIKKGLRTLNLWYIGYVTHQVSRFATAVSRSLHLVDERLQSLERELAAQRVPPSGVVDAGWAHRGDAWWVPVACDAVASVPGRVLHAASGDGWLVRALGDRGVDAYGVDPRPGVVSRAELEGADLREEDVLEHLRAVAPASLGGVVLSGVVDGMAGGERQQLLSLLADRLAPEGAVVLHSLGPAAWSSERAPLAADLAPGRPLRPASWVSVLDAAGFGATVPEAPTADDYLVVAVRRPVVRPR